MELIEPLQMKLTRERFAPRRWLAKFRRSYRDVERLITQTPGVLADLLDRMKAGTVTVRHEHQHLQTAVNRLVVGLLTAALFIGSSQMCVQPLPPVVSGVSIPGVVGCLVALVLGGHLLRTDLPRFALGDDRTGTGHRLSHPVRRGRQRPGYVRPGARQGAAERLVGHAGRDDYILWNTVYLSRAVDQLRAEGHDLPDELVARLLPSAGSISA